MSITTNSRSRNATIVEVETRSPNFELGTKTGRAASVLVLIQLYGVGVAHQKKLLNILAARDARLRTLNVQPRPLLSPPLHPPPALRPVPRALLRLRGWVYGVSCSRRCAPIPDRFSSTSSCAIGLSGSMFFIESGRRAAVSRWVRGGGRRSGRRVSRGFGLCAIKRVYPLYGALVLPRSGSCPALVSSQVTTKGASRDGDNAG